MQLGTKKILGIAMRLQQSTNPGGLENPGITNRRKIFALNLASI